MTEILVESLDQEGGVVQPNMQSSASIQMQGFAADGVLDPLHVAKKTQGDSAEKRDRANSRASMPTSVRSEPDLDTIMPLPGSGFYRKSQGGYQRVPGEGSDTDSEGSGAGGEGSPYSTAIASFTTVEVAISYIGYYVYMFI